MGVFGSRQQGDEDHRFARDDENGGGDDDGDEYSDDDVESLNPNRSTCRHSENYFYFSQISQI